MQNKYNEIMDHVKVDDEMRERVLRAVLEDGTHHDRAIREKKKTRKISFFGRMNRLAAAAAVVLIFALAGIGFVTVTMRSRADLQTETTMMMEDTADTTEGDFGGAEEKFEEANEVGAAVYEENSGQQIALIGGNEISARYMVEMVSGRISDYVSVNGTETSATVSGVTLYDCDGELDLEFENDRISYVVWTELDGEKTFSELAVMISEDIGIEPERVEAGSTGDDSEPESYMYVWYPEGKMITLDYDLVVEVSSAR